MGIVFDAPQKKAVYADMRPLLVLAGPGSGKTTVLVHRIACLTGEMKIPPEQLLVLTFTKASAEEMKQRYLKLTGQRSSPVTFGTFHSVFYAFLRQHGYLGAHVLDRQEETAYTKEAITRVMGLDIVSDKMAQAVFDAIGRIKNGMFISEELPVKVYPALKELMRSRGAIDFDDMLLLLYQLLIDCPEVLQQLRAKYRYLLIDEFQDINRTQYEIIKLLAHPLDHVFAVGDDDQSIYGFRGSDPGYMREFLKDFSGSHKVILNANHRSVGRIVRASKRLIGHNRKRFSKRLVSVSEKGTAPVYRGFETMKEQMAYVEKKLLFFRENMPASREHPFQAAILARTGAVLREGALLIREDLKDTVSWMTFHASKGLEFDAVFILCAEEGTTPDRRNLKDGGLEEERRCFYVAVTRCKKYLHILYTKSHYNKKTEKSRFVSEMKGFFP